MPLFNVSKKTLAAVGQKSFTSEKALQQLIEDNLDTVFKCRFVATEFSTGAKHAGRIDTLALSEDDNPVIIEYKVVESSDLLNQSMYYLAWIHDHKGDFTVAAKQALGDKVNIDWSDVRVICIAPNYKKYDLHAAQVMGANIELWTYRLFANDVLYLEEVLRKADATLTADGKNPVMVAAGKKAALTKLTGSYTFEEHLAGKSADIVDLVEKTRQFIQDLDPAIEVVPKKLYVAFRISQNIVCLDVKQKKLLLYLKLDPSRLKTKTPLVRDVTNIGHFGTGDVEVTVSTPNELELAKTYIRQAYEEVGG